MTIRLSASTLSTPQGHFWMSVRSPPTTTSDSTHMATTRLTYSVTVAADSLDGEALPRSLLHLLSLLAA